jgi:ornithine cyclodeaminase/alanine dehydrogenase-like protein (mu-crystallin family)
VRQITPVPGEDGFIASMPAVGQAMAVKIVTLYHSNARMDLPTHQGVILLFDKSNGSPLAVMDGRLITEMRTAAGSAAAARALVPKQCDVLTIIGTGVQARAHAAALAHVRTFQAVRITGRNAEAGAALASDIGAAFVADAETAVRDADIFITATSVTEPVLHGAWLKPGAFVSSVGWNGPEGRELDAATANTVIVESRAAALDQAGDIRANSAKIYAEIGEICAGTKSPPADATII